LRLAGNFIISFAACAPEALSGAFFIFIVLLLNLVPGHHQLQNGVEQIGGLGEQGIDVPFPFDAFQEEQDFSSPLQQFGGDVAQDKIRIAKIGVVIWRAVKRIEPPDDF